MTFVETMWLTLIEILDFPFLALLVGFILGGLLAMKLGNCND